MRILMLAPGSAFHSQRVINLLLSEGCELICVDAEDPLPQGAVGYSFSPLRPIRGTRFHWVRNRVAPWMSALRLRRIWRGVRPDVVNVQWVDDRVVACVRAGLRPLVISCWGSDINYHFQPEYAKSWHRRGLGRAIASADYVTADTQEILERCEIMARRALRTQLFYFGIDPARFRAGFAAEASTLRQGLGISREARVIFNPRRLQPPMGHRHTLRAFAELTNTVGVPESVIVFKSYARACSETEEEIRKEVGKLGLANRVFWLGETSYSEVPVHYAMADLVVNYPELDGFPVSFFEAALCRRPVVTSDLLAYRGVFDHAFVSVRPADATALANALHHCLTEPPEETRRRVDKAYSIALDIGDQRKCIRVLTSVFSEASKAHSRREGTATDSSGYNRGRSRQ